MPPRPFSEQYHLRRVAENSSKPCFLCYKPTAAVLVSEDGKADFFYICDSHLKDASFATPKADPAAEAAKLKKKLLDDEIEKLKKEWEDISKKKDDKDKDKDKKKDAKAAAEQLKSLSEQSLKEEDISEQSVRVFTLHTAIYNIRLNNWRAAQRAKQTQTMLKNQTLFPKVPNHRPGQSSTASPGPDQGPAPGPENAP